MQRMLGLMGAAALIGTVASAAPIGPVINEFVANTTGTDQFEFAEVKGQPNEDLSAFTIVEIEGDAGAIGLIDDFTFGLGVANAGGYYATPYQNNIMENGSLTLLLVAGYTGALNQDIDTNDDGIIDVTPWSAIIDSIAINDGGATDITYGVTLGVAYDGQPFAPGGASRIPDGTDTDTSADWKRNDFGDAAFPNTAAGLPGGDLSTWDTALEALNTPGAVNVPEPASLALIGLGVLALRRR